MKLISFAAAAALIIALILFFLSVIAPINTENRFWKAIHKIRLVMDMTSYWFFNLCGIAAIVYILIMIVRSYIRNML